MSAKITKVAVVILNWNRKDDTVECLKSLRRLSTVGFELSIIVVDNGSTDGSIEAFNKITNVTFKLIELKENTGFVEGNNAGINLALDEGADYVMALNNDTLVDKSLVRELLKSAEKNKGAGIFVPKIYFAPGFEFHKDRYPKSLLGKVIWSAGGKIDWDNIYASNNGVDDVDRGQYDEEKETDFATGACLFVRRKVLEKVGAFDSKYFAYMEDTDLCERAKRAGFKVAYVPKAYLWHKVSQSSGIGSNLNDYFLTRNRMLFGMRYASLRTKLALIRESIKLLFTGRTWQKAGIRDFYLMRFGKGSWK
jgi:GT2 family glycosyltransferase